MFFFNSFSKSKHLVEMWKSFFVTNEKKYKNVSNETKFEKKANTYIQTSQKCAQSFFSEASFI
jgi:hypothetical protein